MKLKTLLMDETAINRAVMRLSYEIIERTDNLENTILMGIKTRGEPLAEMIKRNIYKNANVMLQSCALDITHYRDDARRNTDDVEVREEPDFSKYAGKDVILVDDVLFTGRTTRAAMDAILSKVRVASIRLVVLIDRGHRELPIRADFVGKNVPTSLKEKIVLKIKEVDGESSVSIYEE